jgi:DNA-binding LytR/AlgR family response regulator
MESYTVIIAEDDPRIAKMIALYCEKCNLNVVFLTDSGLELIDACSRYRPDMVLLDIGLNDLDGISAIQAMNQKDFFPQIVIISGAQSFSDAFNSINAVNAIYILSKPVQINIFETAIHKAIAKIESQKNKPAASSEKHWIKVKSSKTDILVLEESMVYVVQEERQTLIYLTNRSTIMTASGILDILNQAKNLYSPYKGFLVNLNYITSYKKECYSILRKHHILMLYTQTKIPLRRDKINKLSHLLLNKSVDLLGKERGG